MKRLIKKQKAQIFYLYSCYLSCQNIGDKLNIERSVVNWWIRKWGIQRDLSESHEGQHSSPKTQFKKNQMAWNKGIKRYWDSPKFKKGFTPWNKGKKTGIVPKSVFKKGQIAFNKGKSAPWARGENNVNWKGGISDEYRKIRKSDQYKQWRRDIFVRDQFTCQSCGHRFIKIVAHHIKEFSDYPELRFDTDNGQTLCRVCHCKIHNPAKKVKYEFIH